MNNESIIKIPNRLQFFPVMMFAIVMGLSGLTLVFKKASEVYDTLHIIPTLFSYLSITIFAMILITYMIKYIKYTPEVKKEWVHPIRINFFAAISISFILISMIMRSYSISFADALFIFGALLHLFFTFNTLSFWINQSLDIQHSNPAWFIPIVGNLIVPVGGVGVISNEFLMFYFSIGIFFWIIMLSIILNRIIFHKQFAAKFMPTLFILIAPPSVGLLAYFKMFESLDTFALILYNLGLFFTLLVIFMYKKFINIQFFISWWAFTFPLATITLATLLMYEQKRESIYIYLSNLLILFLTIVVAIVAVNTIKYMFKREICIME